jgi:hypothetical protein
MPDGQRVPPGAPDEATEQEASLAEEAAPEIPGPRSMSSVMTGRAWQPWVRLGNDP